MQAASPADQLRSSSQPTEGRPLVVLLHGLAQGRGALERLRRYIQDDTQMRSISLEYPSTEFPILKLAQGVATEVQDLVSQGGHSGVWAVTYSLGAIVQRHIMGLPVQGGISWKGIVMIAPPNQGSSLCRQLSHFPGVGKLFQFANGVAGVEVGAEMAEGNAWPDPPQPCGIIAGTQAFSSGNPTSWLTSAFGMLPGPSDGNVAVEETKLRPGFPADLVLVPFTHTSIARSAKVAQLVTQFIKHGCFLPSSAHEQLHPTSISP